MDKLEIGQTLYSLNVGNAARNCEQKLTKVKVTKIGRKYFSVRREEGYHDIQYCLDTWSENSNYCSDTQLYQAPQDWVDEKEKDMLTREIKKAFDWVSRREFSLGKLRRIYKIMEA